MVMLARPLVSPWSTVQEGVFDVNAAIWVLMFELILAIKAFRLAVVIRSPHQSSTNAPGSAYIVNPTYCVAKGTERARVAAVLAKLASDAPPARKCSAVTTL